MKWRLITCLILAFCIVLPSATVAAEDTDVTGTVPLVASDIVASNIGYYGATIFWKTNGDATSQVFYDTVYHEDIGDYAYSTEDTALVTEHSIPLTGLSAGTTYHYRVRSAIPNTEFITISEDYTFKTSSPPPVEEYEDYFPPAYYIKTDLFGTGKWYRRIESDGEILQTIEAASEDGMLTMTIPQGTIALGKDSKRLKSLLAAAIDKTPPPTPQDAHIVGLAYDFGPAGAMFSPRLTLTWNYDPDVLPEGVTEESLIMAYYDEGVGEWIGLVCEVDTENNTITGSVSHFTTFAIIGSVTPPPVTPPPVTPPDEVVVVEEEEVIILTPPAISVSNLSIQPEEVSVGQELRIEVAVTNTGGTQGSYTLVLNINGVKEAERTVTIDAGDTLNLIFPVTRDDPGSYTITVDGLNASFTVVRVVTLLPAPTNWALIGGIIIAVLVVGLLVYFLVMRRRGSIR